MPSLVEIPSLEEDSCSHRQRMSEERRLRMSRELYIPSYEHIWFCGTDAEAYCDMIGHRSVYEENHGVTIPISEIFDEDSKRAIKHRNYLTEEAFCRLDRWAVSGLLASVYGPESGSDDEESIEEGTSDTDSLEDSPPPLTEDTKSTLRERGGIVSDGYGIEYLLMDTVKPMIRGVRNNDVPRVVLKKEFLVGGRSWWQELKQGPTALAHDVTCGQGISTPITSVLTGHSGMPRKFTVTGVGLPDYIHHVGSHPYDDIMLIPGASGESISLLALTKRGYALILDDTKPMLHCKLETEAIRIWEESRLDRALRGYTEDIGSLKRVFEEPLRYMKGKLYIAKHIALQLPYLGKEGILTWVGVPPSKCEGPSMFPAYTKKSVAPGLSYPFKQDDHPYHSEILTEGNQFAELALNNSERVRLGVDITPELPRSDRVYAGTPSDAIAYARFRLGVNGVPFSRYLDPETEADALAVHDISKVARCPSYEAFLAQRAARAAFVESRTPTGTDSTVPAGSESK